MPSKNAAEAVTDAAAGGARVIVAIACRFVTFDGADRLRSVMAASAAASGGRGDPIINFSNLLTDLHL